MCRAIVISVLFHLLMLTSLVELRLLPTDTLRKASGLSLLSVRFEPTHEIVRQDMAVASGRPVLTSKPGSPVGVKPHGEGKPRKSRDSSSPGDAVESVAFLPADLEREYRINLAREARRFHDYPAEIIAKGQEGIVRMTISYWRRLGRPSVVLEQSSGYRDLDQEALKSVALAIARVPLPAGVQGINFRMQYALEYRLAD